MRPNQSTPGGFPIPDRYDMPDLSSLFPKQTLDLMLNMFIGHEPEHARVAHPQYVNLVRLTDKALEEYLIKNDGAAAMGREAGKFAAVHLSRERHANALTRLYEECRN